MQSAGGSKTPYRAANDAALAVWADGCARLCGGHVRASGENFPAETASQARGIIQQERIEPDGELVLACMHAGLL